ncbi:hypothetical protein CANMA_000895 [Candida margitis]|uniref:uncharacterized protein n=1 Tax=Candida margitis TaxID=1775924 RepID=UPI002226D1B4|nr:uncharacterized protein CANMA_000895 [Candida margitis]KAI5970071.1 hypothetical protein CANMA_000895 [Candida margitis]
MSNVPKSPISSKAVTPSSSSSSSPPRSPSQPSPPMSPLPPPLQSELENNEESLQSEQKQEQQQEQQKPQPKQRKVQTAEEYAHQLSLWRSSGPQINTETWLYEDLDKLNPIENKVDSAKLLHACEKAYYLRDWHHCLQLCNLGARLFAVDLDQVGDAMKQDLQSTNRRKRLGKKHERSVVDLYDIKQRCSSRMKEKDAEQAFGS